MSYPDEPNLSLFPFGEGNKLHFYCPDCGEILPDVDLSLVIVRCLHKPKLGEI